MKRTRSIDRQLLADPAIRKALAEQQQQAHVQAEMFEMDVFDDSATPPAPVLIKIKIKPWGSAFMVAVDTSTGYRHATADRIVTVGCNFSTSGMTLANGCVGPGGTWLKPNCQTCLGVVEVWERTTQNQQESTAQCPST